VDFTLKEAEVNAVERLNSWESNSYVGHLDDRNDFVHPHVFSVLGLPCGGLPCRGFGVLRRSARRRFSAAARTFRDAAA
jgi:hypothetical protein